MRYMIHVFAITISTASELQVCLLRCLRRSTLSQHMRFDERAHDEALPELAPRYWVALHVHVVN